MKKTAASQMVKLKKIIPQVFPFLIIALAALAMINLLKGHIYSMWDTPVPALDPALLQEKALYCWDSWYVGGRFYCHTFYFPYFLTVRLLNYILPLGASNTMVYYILFTLSGISMYLFASSVNVEMERNLKKALALMASLSYMFNTHWIFRIESMMSISYVLAFFPLLLLFLKESLFSSSKSVAIRNVIISSLVTVAMTPGVSTQLIFALFIAIVYLFFLSVLTRKLWSFLFTTISFAAFFFATNLWWIMPQLFSRLAIPIIIRSEEYVGHSLQIVENWAPFTTALNALRMMVYDLPSMRYAMPWTELYETPLFIMLSILIPVISVFPLLSKRSRKFPEILAFGLIWITVLPVIIGLDPPTGPFFLWVFEHIPFMIFRRSPDFVFGIHLFCSYFFGLGIVIIYDFLKDLTHYNKQLSSKFNKYKLLMKKCGILAIPVTIVAFSVMILPFPLWLGFDYRVDLGGQSVSALIEIPSYVNDLVSYLNTQPNNYGVLVLPEAETVRGFNWNNGYFGWDPYYLMLNRPVLSFKPDYLNPVHSFTNELYDRLATFDFYSELEVINQTTIWDDGEAFWKMNKDGIGNYDGTILEETVEKQNETSSLRIVVTSGVYSDLYLDHAYNIPQNFYSYDYFSWWWYGRNSGATMRLQFFTETNSRSYYEFIDNFDEWKRFLVPFSSFVDVNDGVNWSNVDYIRFQIIPRQNEDFYLDCLSLATSSIASRTEFGKILALLGIKYIILVNDALPGLGDIPSFSSARYQSLLSEQENIRLVKTFGSHLLYENFCELRTFYASTSVIRSDTSSNETLLYFQILMELDDPFKIVFSQNMALNEDSPPPIITAERINPVTYKVHVLNASCPYLLVSPLTYDNNWIAEVDSAKLQPIKVNGLFGGWLIDKTGDYIIMVHYITQNYIESAYSVSFAIILVLGLFLILSQCRVKKQQLLRPLFAIRCYSRRKISEK